MSEIVDLTNLREMTGGDAELEQTLFEEFIRSGEELLATLKTSQANETREAWRSAAHALKGSALNLGAAQLGDLCKQAQDGFENPAETKAALYAQINTAFSAVKTFLESRPA